MKSGNERETTIISHKLVYKMKIMFTQDCTQKLNTLYIDTIIHTCRIISYKTMLYSPSTSVYWEIVHRKYQVSFWHWSGYVHWRLDIQATCYYKYFMITTHWRLDIQANANKGLKLWFKQSCTLSDNLSITWIFKLTTLWIFKQHAIINMITTH